MRVIWGETSRSIFELRGLAVRVNSVVPSSIRVQQEHLIDVINAVELQRGSVINVMIDKVTLVRVL